MKYQFKLLVTAVMLAGAATAQAQIYKVTLSGANENPAVVTSGAGTSVITLNTTTHELRVRAVFSGLNGNTTASHVHCCVAAPTANAGVITATPTFAGFPLGVKEGTFDVVYNTLANATWNASYVTANGTAAGAETSFVNGVNSGGAYLNIHSATSLGGEIRGTLVPFSFATTANSATTGIAASLNSLGAGTGAVNERLVTIAMLNASQQQAALASLQPLPGSALALVTSNSLFSNYDQIGNRLGGLRDEASTAANGFWISAASLGGEQELDSRNVTVDSEGYEVAAGLDRQLDDSWLVGAALGFTGDSLDFADAMQGSDADIEGWHASVYGEYQVGNAYVDGMLSLANQDNELVHNSGLVSLSRAHADSEQIGARLAAGLKLDLGTALSLTPQLRLDWSSLDVDGYREVGGSGLGLNVMSQKIDRLRATVGGQLDWAFSPTVRPYARVFLSNDFKDDANLLGATFVSGGTAFFTSDGGLDNSGYVAGVGINMSSGNLGGSFSYDRTESDNVEYGRLQARLLLRF